MKSNDSAAQVFPRRLQRLAARARRRALVFGLLRFGALGLPPLLLAIWAVGGTVGPGGFNGWGLSLSLLAGLVCLAFNFVYRPWRHLRRPLQLAALIERRAGFDNLIVAAEEAGRCPERWSDRTPVAVELKRRLFERADLALGLVNTADLMPMRYGRVAAGLLLAGVLAGAVLLVTSPVEMRRGVDRLTRPGPEPEADLVGGLFTVAGSAAVLAGTDVTLEGVDFAGSPQAAVAEIKVGSGTWQTLPTRAVSLLDIPLGLPDPYHKWQAVVSDVREDFAWRLRRGTALSAARRIQVRHYPLLVDLAARVVTPEYTNLPARDFARLPAWIEVPAGSRLELTGRLNHPVRTATLVTESGDSLRLALATTGPDSLTVRGTLPIDRDYGFAIALVDAHDLQNQLPLRYEVIAAADQVPAVSLERPTDDGILPLAGEINLESEAADDYGLTRLRLLARIGVAGAHRAGGDEWLGGDFWRLAAGDSMLGRWLAIPTGAGEMRVRAKRLDDGDSPLRARFGLEVRTEDLDLVAGDGLELVVEAVDNKRPLPAGRSRSPRLRLQLPSAAEVLVTRDEANDSREDALQEMRRRSEDLNEDLDRLTRELLKNPVPDWARQQEMEAAIERQKKLQDELARVAEEMRRELEKLAQSQLASEAQLEKADEMSELLQQKNSTRLNDIVENLSEGGQASPEDLARAMDEVARNQKEMARRLDAALAMLKRMAQEQELEGLTALLEQMIQKQQELTDLSRELAERQAAADEARDANEQEVAAAAEKEPDEAGPEAGQSGDQEQQPNTDAGGDKNQEESAGDTDEFGQEQAQPESDTAEASDPTNEELARRQQALEQEMEQLQEQLEKALENLREENAENPQQAGEDMAEALQKALDQVKQQREQDKMGQAGEELSQMDPAEAAKMQEQALRDLGSLYSVLLKSQQAMQQAMKMEQVGSLRGLAADLLALSARQEEVSGRIPPQLRDLRDLDLTRSQHRLQKSAVNVRAGLSELMAEAPNRIMKLLKQLDDLIETMGLGLQAMEDNRAPVARRQAVDSLAKTNRIVIGLLTEAQMQSSSGGGGSGSPQQSLSEKLQQMAQEQAGLNGVTEELRRMLADRGISQQARSQMKRLGEQQAEMAGRMGELAEEEREQPEGERMLGDLAEMGRQMEQIGREIDDGLVSEETLVRQERILSRMLDARNSVRRRDFSARRESRAGDELYAAQQGRLGNRRAEANSPFRLKYQPLEQAPMEYRNLVRRYFAALDSLGRLAPESNGTPPNRSVP